MTASGNLRQRRGKSPPKGETTAEESIEKEPLIEDDDNDGDNHDGYLLTPLIQRSLLGRLDVGPFLLVYFLLIYADYQHGPISSNSSSNNTSKNDPQETPLSSTAILLHPLSLVFAVVLVGHLMLILMQQWNVQVKSWVGYQRGTQKLIRGGDSRSDVAAARNILASWTHCFVQEVSSLDYVDTPPPTATTSSEATKKQSSAAAGKSTAAGAGIAPVQVIIEKNNNSVAIVQFHDITFRCPIVPKALDLDATIWDNHNLKKKSNDNNNNLLKCRCTLSFHRVRYPIHLPLSFYAHEWNGHSSFESVMQCQQLYGANVTVLELPAFVELLSEQVVAPFFLFQIFCVALWSLDEYWYYAIFTLFALLAFESTVAYNRLQSLQRLRTASRQNTQKLWAYRQGYALKTGKKSSSSSSTTTDWIRITAQEIVPGDIVSVTMRQEGWLDGNSSSSNNNKSQRHNSVPADILVLQGNAVVDEALLTGESLPQLKVPLESTISATNANERLELQEHKDSVLFGGTVLLTANSSIEEEVSSSSSGKSSNEKKGANEKGIPAPPDDGVVGVVLRTGFETAQGSLLRTIAHSSKSADGVHTKDTFVFIFMLLCCALASASVVLRDGWNDDTRNRFRLVLHVIIVLTSVIPPELPMELSLCVTNSVADLIKRCQVFCTEHHRIAWAGSVDVCCFDKTGTLTSDQMRLKGVRMLSSEDLDVLDEDEALVSPSSEDTDALPWSTTRVMAACHSLALNFGRGSSGPQLIGDPLEQAVLKDTGYQLVGNNMLTPMQAQPGRPKSITILHRFAFASRLKRMTTLVSEEDSADWDQSKKGTVWALTKGAPETIRDLLKPDSLPSDYDSVSTYHMARGRRVLAMGYRSLGPNRSARSLKDEGREKIEKDLTFAGFLILDCPLKSDSKSVISELRNSHHNVVMITGDAVLTAAEVSRQVGIIPNSEDNKKHVTYWLQERSISGSTKPLDPLSRFAFVQLSPKKTPGAEATLALSSNMNNLRTMVESGSASFCLTGDMLTKVAKLVYDKESDSTESQGTPKTTSPAAINEKSLLLHPRSQTVLQELVSVISVFARHAPHQKEAVVAAFNHSGHYTCMVGDGTNDVGALKRAHVGISIISAPDAESKQLQARSKLKKERKKGRKSSTSSQKRSMEQEYRRMLREAQDEIDQVELGDASMASPFTSKQVSIKCCKDVLQQGRCTLVTMLQIYKILGINCLVNAMVLSTLFLHGVKQGDRQLTVLGMVVAGLFFFVTRGKPLSTISPLRPPSSVLCPHALLSIALQFTIHCCTILLATNAALSFVDPYDPSIIPDGPFNPNVLNTCTFMLTVLSTINTFAVNYRGRPFMEDLRENKVLVRSLLVCYGSLFLCAYEAFPPLNDLLQLSSFPPVTVTANASDPSVMDDDWLASVMESDTVLSTLVRALDFPTFMTVLMVIDTALSFFVEKTILRIFEPM